MSSDIVYCWAWGACGDRLCELFKYMNLESRKGIMYLGIMCDSQSSGNGQGKRGKIVVKRK